MSGGGSANQSKSKNSSSYNERVWEGQEDALKDVYTQAGDLFGDTKSQFAGLNDQAVENQQKVFEASQPHWQNQMQGGAYKDMNLGQNVMRSLNDSMNQPTAMQDIYGSVMGGQGNNYADAMKQTYVDDANRSMENMNSTLDARAAGSGMGGSSRHGVAQGVGMRGINDRLQNNLARTGYETFDKDLQNKLKIAQQADQGTLQRQQMMTGMLGSQNKTMNQGLLGGQNQQNLNMGQYDPGMKPWEAMGQYANAVGRPTVLGSGQSEGESSGWGMTGYGGVGPSGGGGGGGGGGG